MHSLSILLLFLNLGIACGLPIILAKLLILVGILKATAPPAAIGSASMAAAGASAAAATKIAAGTAVAGIISGSGGTILLGQLLDTQEGVNEQLDGIELKLYNMPN